MAAMHTPPPANDAELVLRSTRLPDGRLADIAIRAGRIARITPQAAGATAATAATAATPAPGEIDAAGALVLPGFVDGHIHLDKALVGVPWLPHEKVRDRPERIAREKLALASHPVPLAQRAENLVRRLVAYGTTHLRCHVDIDPELRLRHLHTLCALRDKYRDRLTMEFVAFPQSGVMARPGTLELLDAALGEGADLLGGLDPAGYDGDVTGQLDGLFSIARRRGVRLDIHLHDPGMLGAFQCEQIARRTVEGGLHGRVVISHAYGLGAVPDDVVTRTADTLAAAGIAIVTNAPGTGPMPPVKTLKSHGVEMFSGSDNIRDCWWPYGNGDMLERAMFIGYRQDLFTDEDLHLACEMGTDAAARALGLPDYGLREGATADLVLVESEGVPQAVVDHPPRKLVLKAGRVVARDGQMLG